MQEVDQQQNYNRIMDVLSLQATVSEAYIINSMSTPFSHES